MQVSYQLFRKNPNQSELDKIINNVISAISNSSDDLRGTGISARLANSYSQYWLLADDDPILTTNKQRIDQNFNDILDDIDKISYQHLSAEAKKIYINIIYQYAEKIKRVYQL
jgi:hypothetical protein